MYAIIKSRQQPVTEFVTCYHVSDRLLEFTVYVVELDFINCLLFDVSLKNILFLYKHQFLRRHREAK